MDPTKAIKKTLSQLKGVEDVYVTGLVGGVFADVTIEGRPNVSGYIHFTDWDTNLEELISKIEDETH